MKPIKFVVRSVILEPDTRWACVETRGFATRKSGMFQFSLQEIMAPTSKYLPWLGLDAPFTQPPLLRAYISRFELTIAGKPYNNDYIWLTQWNDEGKIVYVRSYFDTMLSQEALHDNGQ